MARVSIDQLTHRYSDGKGNATVAVEDFDVEIADGEFVVLVGPPGVASRRRWRSSQDCRPRRRGAFGSVTKT